MLDAPAGCCPAALDALACREYQAYRKPRQRAYGCEAHFADGKRYGLSGRFQRQLHGPERLAVALLPVPGGKDCRGFGVFRCFFRPLP